MKKNSFVNSLETWLQSKELHYFKLYEKFWTLTITKTKNAIGDIKDIKNRDGRGNHTP